MMKQDTLHLSESHLLHVLLPRMMLSPCPTRMTILPSPPPKITAKTNDEMLSLTPKLLLPPNSPRMMAMIMPYPPLRMMMPPKLELPPSPQRVMILPSPQPKILLHRRG